MTDMPDMPADGEGLAWIVAHGFTELNLSPGILPSSILAASLGNQPAVSYLQARAQKHAAANSIQERLLDCGHWGVPRNCMRCRPSPELRLQREHTSQVFLKAAGQGSLPAMHWLRVLCEPQLDSTHLECMQLAAARGDISMIMFLRAGPAPQPALMLAWDIYYWQIVAAAATHPKCLAWLLQQGLACPEWGFHRHVGTALDNLATNGHLQAMIYIHDHARQIPEDSTASLMVTAAEHGHTSMVQWLRSLDSPEKEWPMRLCTVAAGNGNLSLLQWLRDQDPPCPWFDHTCTAAAAANGDLATLQWLCAQDPPCETCTSCTFEAARCGRMDMLKWLRAQPIPCSWDSGCTAVAAFRQDFAMLQWLHAQECPWNPHCSLAAAAGGSIPILQWLSTQDPPCHLSEDCMAAAALRGHLPMMQHLHGMGCSLDGMLYYLAAEANAPDVLQWLLKQKVPAPTHDPTEEDYGFDRFDGCIHDMKEPMLLFLKQIGAPLPPPHCYELTERVRKVFCIFHSLLLWSRRAVADPRKGIPRAFNRLPGNTAGEHLLIRLSMLPQELINKIATMAGIQHDLL